MTNIKCPPWENPPSRFAKLASQKQTSLASLMLRFLGKHKNTSLDLAFFKALFAVIIDLTVALADELPIVQFSKARSGLDWVVIQLLFNDNHFVKC